MMSIKTDSRLQQHDLANFITANVIHTLNRASYNPHPKLLVSSDQIGATER